MKEKGKVILILGNGFDLAHNLPTRYSDFIDFCIGVCNIFDYEIEGFTWQNLNLDYETRQKIDYAKNYRQMYVNSND